MPHPLIHRERLSLSPRRCRGTIRSLQGSLIRAYLPAVAVGDYCTIERLSSSALPTIAIGFDGDLVTLAPLAECTGITPRSAVLNSGEELKVPLPQNPLGMVLGSLGGSLMDSDVSGRSHRTYHSLIRAAPPPLSRPPIRAPFTSGVGVIDALCTLGEGQRVGLIAPAGVGKSTLLGMITRNASVDAVVVGLIGERGREVNEFLLEALGAEGRSRSVVIASTAEEPPLTRWMALLTATTIAEQLRSQGKRVLLLIDSLTRAARALRDVGLASGELPVRQGYPPSVYFELPRVLERAGTAEIGSITAIYTILVHDERETDALADELKSLLDGHLVLSSTRVQRGIRPALDPVQSISRTQAQVSTAENLRLAHEIRALIQRLEADRDIVLFGGTPDPQLRFAIEQEQKLNAILSQPSHVRLDPAEVIAKLHCLMAQQT